MTTTTRGAGHGPLVFGTADGLVLALGLIAGFAAQPRSALHAAIFAGIAEAVGMTAGQWLSDSPGGFIPAAGCGLAAFGACVLPVLPFTAGTGPVAYTAALILVALVAAAIARLRPERGALAAVQTYGVLAVAGILCYAVSAI